MAVSDLKDVKNLTPQEAQKAINRLIAELKALEARVATLEAA